MRSDFAGTQPSLLGAVVLSCCLFSGCNAGPSRYEANPTEPRIIDSVEQVPTKNLVALDSQAAQDASLSAGVLLPRAPSDDKVLAKVGDIVIRKSHVYDHLLEIELKQARNLVDQLVMDAVVASHAEQHGITVDSQAIDALVESEEKKMRTQVQRDWGGRLSFEKFLSSQFDLTPEDNRRYWRLGLARERYRAYVIRYMAMLEDRVEVRFLVNSDRKIVEESAELVREGADFATLAMRHSEDETRRDGGMMPPFGRDFTHPIAKVSFELEPGALSEIFAFKAQGVDRFCVVYCLRKMPSREADFASVRAEIVEGLEQRPLAGFERKAYILRWCSSSQPSETPR